MDSGLNVVWHSSFSLLYTASEFKPVSMDGAFISMLLAAILLACPGYSHSSEQFLEQTLDASDQQLDALTHRVLSLSNQLDEILAERDDAELQAKRFTRLLDVNKGKKLTHKRPEYSQHMFLTMV